MKKRVINRTFQASEPLERSWLDLEPIAAVELTSEDSRFPIESALTDAGEHGWRADRAGPQTIRLIFASPQHVRRIRVEFREKEMTRTQQFVIRYGQASDQTAANEVVRQQWNFSPEGSTEEVEEFQVDLTDVSILELEINPDIAGGDARAGLWRWQLG